MRCHSNLAPIRRQTCRSFDQVRDSGGTVEAVTESSPRRLSEFRPIVPYPQTTRVTTSLTERYTDHRMGLGMCFDPTMEQPWLFRSAFLRTYPHRPTTMATAWRIWRFSVHPPGSGTSDQR